MSFWDHIKPTPRPVRATAVDLTADGRRLTLAWDDGQKTEVTARALRQACPCAECVDEWTRKRTFDPATVPEDMKILEVRPVGNYALSFTFGDAHATGIFNWGLLRGENAK
jgi:DUF971 family protein